MANIIINNYCNQQCPYCFTEEMMSNPKWDINLEEFKKIFQQLKIFNLHSFGIIGGEPTLSPNLKDILKFINMEKKYYKMEITIFTNGTNLKPFLDYFDKDYKILININSSEFISKSNIEKTINSLDLLKNYPDVQVDLGVTLFPGMKNKYYILDLAKIYNKFIIRASYASPTKNLVNDPEKYYFQGKELFLDFLKECEKNNIKVELDCNKIPLCYFSDEEKNIFNKVLNNYDKIQYICGPHMDIYPNGDVIPCFGCGFNSQKKNIFHFNNILSLYRYLYFENMLLLMLKNNQVKCQKCKDFNSFKCQGGCLAFNKEKFDIF